MLTLRKIANKEVEENVAVSLLYTCAHCTLYCVLALSVSSNISTMYLDILISVGQLYYVFYV